MDDCHHVPRAFTLCLERGSGMTRGGEEQVFVPRSTNGRSSCVHCTCYCMEHVLPEPEPLICDASSLIMQIPHVHDPDDHFVFNRCAHDINTFETHFFCVIVDVQLCLQCCQSSTIEICNVPFRRLWGSWIELRITLAHTNLHMNTCKGT